MEQRMDERTYTVKETAAKLNKSEITVWRSIRDEKIKSKKILGSRRVPESEITRILEGK